MNKLERTTAKVFAEMMRRCKTERKAKTDLTAKEVAKRIGKTENYVYSIENGREFPSLKTFISYLSVVGFDTEPLTRLSVDLPANTKSKTPAKSKLLDTLYSLSEAEAEFLVEQANVAKIFVKKKK